VSILCTIIGIKSYFMSKNKSDNVKIKINYVYKYICAYRLINKEFLEEDFSYR